MMLLAPQKPSGSIAAPAGSIKSNAADPTASIGSPRTTIPFFNTCLSNLSAIFLSFLRQAGIHTGIFIMMRKLDSTNNRQDFQLRISAGT
jgi:hypothetical protein